MSTSQEVANVYLFLASDKGFYVAGALYTIKGGIIIANVPAGDEADSSFKQQPEGVLKLQHTQQRHTSAIKAAAGVSFAITGMQGRGKGRNVALKSDMQ